MHQPKKFSLQKLARNCFDHQRSVVLHNIGFKISLLGSKSHAHSLNYFSIGGDLLLGTIGG